MIWRPNKHVLTMAGRLALLKTHLDHSTWNMIFILEMAIFRFHVSFRISMLWKELVFESPHPNVVSCLKHKSGHFCAFNASSCTIVEVACFAEEFCAVGCEIPLRESASAAYEFGRTALQASPQLICMHLIKTNRLSVVQTRRCFAPKSLEKCIRQDGDGSAARLRWPIYSDCQVGMGQH